MSIASLHAPPPFIFLHSCTATQGALRTGRCAHGWYHLLDANVAQVLRQLLASGEGLPAEKLRKSSLMEEVAGQVGQ